MKNGCLPLSHFGAAGRGRLALVEPGSQIGSTVQGTHSLRRTKASIIYRATGNLRAVQLLLGHSKIENTVRYLGIDVEVALALAENPEI
jgi:site-specific recombinase XerC